MNQSTRKRLQRELRALEKLGVSEKIADFLTSRGIRGVRGDASRCPLVRHLSGRLGESIQTGTDCVGLHLSEPSGRLELSATLQTFVWRFDTGRYPQLEEK